MRLEHKQIVRTAARMLQAVRMSGDRVQIQAATDLAGLINDSGIDALRAAGEAAPELIPIPDGIGGTRGDAAGDLLLTLADEAGENDPEKMLTAAGNLAQTAQDQAREHAAHAIANDGGGGIRGVMARERMIMSKAMNRLAQAFERIGREGREGREDLGR